MQPARPSQGTGRSPVPGLRDQYGRDRAFHPRDRGLALCDLGSRRCRWSRRRALDRRRSPARHRQRAQSRHLLQDDRPERANDRRLTVAVFCCSSLRWHLLRSLQQDHRTFWPWWAGRSRSRWPATSQPLHWASGETRHHNPGRSAGSSRGGASACSIRNFEILSAGRRDYFGMTSLLNPETGQALINVGQIMADPKWLADVRQARRTRWPTRSAGSTSTTSTADCLGCRWLPGDLCRQLDDQGTSAEMQAFIDEIRKPRGKTVLQEKT